METNYLDIAKEIMELKISEERYLTLKEYLELYFKNHTYMTKEDLEIILKALEKEKKYE